MNVSKSNLKFLAIALLSTLGSQSMAAVYKALPEGGNVEILAIGKPQFIKIQGKGSAPTGELVISGNKVTGNMKFELSTIDTGIPMRNDHMKEKYLQVKDHPTATLELTDVKLAKDWDPAKPKLDKSDFTGTLTLHGQKQPVNGTFTVGDKKDVSAKFKVKLTDYKIDIPSYLGATVANEVEVTVNIAQLAVKSGT